MNIKYKCLDCDFLMYEAERQQHQDLNPSHTVVNLADEIGEVKNETCHIDLSHGRLLHEHNSHHRKTRVQKVEGGV